MRVKSDYTQWTKQTKQKEQKEIDSYTDRALYMVVSPLISERALYVVISPLMFRESTVCGYQSFNVQREHCTWLSILVAPK